MTTVLTADLAASVAERAGVSGVQVAGQTLLVNAPEIRRVAETLRDAAETDLVFLINVTAVDRRTHFEMVYHLQSLDLNHIFSLRVRLADRENPSLPSLVPAFRGALLQEREVFDLFGIRFEGHPDLRRMFLWDGFPGYPLRKDFLRMPGPVTAGLPGFPHEGGENAWPVPGSVPQRPFHPNDPVAPVAPRAEGEAEEAPAADAGGDEGAE